MLLGGILQIDLHSMILAPDRHGASIEPGYMVYWGLWHSAKMQLMTIWQKTRFWNSPGDYQNSPMRQLINELT